MLSSSTIPVLTELLNMCVRGLASLSSNARRIRGWSISGPVHGHVCDQMLQLLLYFFSAQVESIKDITFILAELWDTIQFFNGEHRAKVIVHCVGHVIVRCDNNSIKSFEWRYVVPYYSSLVDVRVEAISDSVYKFLHILILYCVFPVLKFF